MVLLKIYKESRPIVDCGSFESIEEAYLEFMDYARMGYSGYIAAQIAGMERYVGELSVKKIPELKDRLHKLLLES